MSKDLEKAKEILQSGNYTCVTVKGNVLHTSSERGVKPLLKWIDEKTELCGHSAADKVVGKAAAFLYVILGIRQLHACVISRPALDVLQNHNITVSFDILTDAIRNRTDTGYCPMEQATKELNDPQAALTAIIEALKRLNG